MSNPSKPNQLRSTPEDHTNSPFFAHQEDSPLAEAQNTTPGITPGNTQAGVEETRFGVYETLPETIDGSKLWVRRFKLYDKEGVRDVVSVRSCGHTTPSSDIRTPPQVATTWKQLTHRNVASLLDFTVDQYTLVLDWLLDEDVTTYIANHSDADRQNLVGAYFVEPYDRFDPLPAIRCG